MFRWNRVTRGERGGGVYAVSCPTAITNSTLRGNNTRGKGGGVFLYASEARIQNTILWANIVSEAKEIHVRGDSEVTVTYSDVQGGWSEIGNMSVHPQFAGIFPNTHVYHLHGASPCIDAGDPMSIGPDFSAIDIHS